MASTAERSSAGASSTVDPRSETQAYLERHQLAEIMQGLLAELLFAKPADPRSHIIAALERMKVAGNKPLLNVQDLAVVFGMLDVTKRGAVSEQQAHATLRTVLGAAAAGAAAQPGVGAAALDAGAFRQFMSQALAAATPLCKSGVAEL